MNLRTFCHPLCVSVLVFLLFVLAMPGYTQEAPRQHALGQVSIHPTVAAELDQSEAPTTTQAPGTQRILLPLIRTPMRIGPMQFSADVNDNNLPVNPATTFTYGINRLYITTLVEGGQSLRWRVETTWPDGETLETDGTIRFQVEPVSVYLYYTDNSALDRGTYTIRFFLNDEPYHEGTAVIQ